jgi:hypothetical protein
MKKQISMPIAFGKWYVTRIISNLRMVSCVKCAQTWFDDGKIKKRVKCPDCGNRVG